MKERIVIKDEQAIDEWNRTIACYMDIDNSIYKAKFEKVPETWEDLKKLCEEYKQKGIIKDYYVVQDTLIKSHEPETFYERLDIKWISVAENGDIYAGFESDCIATKRTPAQMWNIIKSLSEKF